MLERLEIKEVSLQKTINNKDFRIDTDFWTKEPKLNSNLKYDKIGNCLFNAQYGISISMNEDNIGYPIYRMNEIHNMLCDFEVDKHADISKSELEIFKLNDGDVLFNRTNSFEWVGRTGIYYKQDDRDFVFASYLVRFIPNPEIILPEYLSTYLNSKFGVWDIKRRARQSINQTNVNPEEVKQISIPLLNKDIQLKIKQCFEVGSLKLKLSKSLYTQAKALLTQEIGLDEEITGLNPVKSQTESPNLSLATSKQSFGVESPSFSANYNVKNFKESFGVTGRLDAEYYQPKYDLVIEKIKSYKNGFEPLSIACNLKDKNYSPKENQEYKYIELSNIGKTGDINGCTIDLGQNLPSRARRKVKTNDLVISSIEGSLQSCALVDKEYDNSLCSSGFYAINSEKINSETLIVLFKSELMQSLMKQNCSGTILTGMNKYEFQNIPVPIIDFKIQQQIAKLIDESFSLKKQSEHLLQVAKHTVEIAIEENEEIAMQYIMDNTNLIAKQTSN